ARGRDFERAERILERLPASPAVMGDLALAALGRNEPERALSMLELGLDSAPDDTRLHWNRGLALQALSLELAAAEEFSRVAQAKEPGWSTEALERADGLRKGALARRDSWKAMNAAGMALALDGTPYPATMARRNPDLARLYLYHALRAAPSVERVKALAPLAEVLDDATRTKTASAYVARVAAADFHKRGPLANTYREILTGTRSLEGAEADAFLARLRRSGERDLLLGAILLLHQEDRFVDELTTLVRQSGEPAWYDAPLARGRAQAAQDRGDTRTAETSLQDGLAACRSAGFQYRCVDLQRHLAGLYNRLDRRKEAESLARAALEEAFRGDSWYQEELLLAELVTSARLSHAPALAARSWTSTSSTRRRTARAARSTTTRGRSSSWRTWTRSGPGARCRTRSAVPPRPRSWRWPSPETCCGWRAARCRGASWTACASASACCARTRR
ncbi:hypothetical protein ACLEQD_42695, partial [Corallococcus sp. 4LFB]